jgi:hypothetical protein
VDENRGGSGLAGDLNASSIFLIIILKMWGKYIL